jgi:hypothetical protein
MEPTAPTWKDLLAWAHVRDADERARHGRPAMLTPLLRAAARTRLARFHPYTSHDILRFATVARHWVDRRPEPPVSIGITVNPDEYLVWWGQLLSAYERPTLLLLTTEAEEAVRLAELLLGPWPYLYPIRPLPAAARQSIFWVE